MTSIVTKRFCDAVIRIASSDKDGVPLINGCNPIAETVTGYSAEELEHMRLPDLIAGATAELLREEFAAGAGVNDLVDIFRRYPQASVKKKDGTTAPAEIKAFIVPGEGADANGNPTYGVYEIIIRDKSLSSLLSVCVRKHDRADRGKARCAATGLPAGEFALDCVSAFSGYAARHADAPFCFAMMALSLKRDEHYPELSQYREDYMNLAAAVCWGVRSGLRADDVVVSLDRKALKKLGSAENFLPARGELYFGLGLPYCALFQARKSLDRLRERIENSETVRAVTEAAGGAATLDIGCVAVEPAQDQSAGHLIRRTVEVLYASRSFGGGRTAVYATGKDVERFVADTAGVSPASGAVQDGKTVSE